MSDRGDMYLIAYGTRTFSNATSSIIREHPEGVIGLILITAICAAVYAFWTACMTYASFHPPYNYVFGFYYYVFVLPLKAVPAIYHFFVAPGLTHLRFLNASIGVVVDGAYIMLLLLAFEFLKQTGLFLLYLAPGILAGLGCLIGLAVDAL